MANSLNIEQLENILEKVPIKIKLEDYKIFLETGTNEG
jgi:hypothetical protein